MAHVLRDKFIAFSNHHTRVPGYPGYPGLSWNSSPYGCLPEGPEGPREKQLRPTFMGLEILDLGNRKRHSVIPMVVRAKFIICSYQLIILIRLLENSCKIGRSLLLEFLSSEKSLLGFLVQILDPRNSCEFRIPHHPEYACNQIKHIEST